MRFRSNGSWGEQIQVCCSDHAYVSHHQRQKPLLPSTLGIDPTEPKKLTKKKQYKYNNFCKPINPMCLTLPNWNWNYSATFTSPNARHHPCPWAGQLRTLNRLGPQNLASLQAVLRYTQHAPTSSSKFDQQPPPLVLHSAVLLVTRIQLALLVPPLAPATICSEGCCRWETFTESWASPPCCLFFYLGKTDRNTKEWTCWTNAAIYLVATKWN